MKPLPYWGRGLVDQSGIWAMPGGLVTFVAGELVSLVSEGGGGGEQLIKNEKEIWNAKSGSVAPKCLAEQ